MINIKDMYLASPEIIQNTAISLYGLTKYCERFLGPIPKEYSRIENVINTPSEDAFRIQQKRLTKLLRHTKQHVQFYKNFLKNENVEKIKATDIEKYFPVVTKKDILQNPGLFISDQILSKMLSITLHTSGSSGTPLRIHASPESRRINYRYYSKALEQFDCKYLSKSTTIAGRILYKHASSNIARYDRFNSTQYLSSYDISRRTIKKYIDSLNNWEPRFIDSYPSALIEIISLAKKHDLTLTHKPSLVFTSSENLTIQTRANIEDFFGCSVLDQYGCTEMCINAFSIGGNYYSDPRYSINEIESFNGHSGSLICTGLINKAMPLIRYDIGDLVTPFEGNNYIFEKIDGRLDDTIITPEGRRIGRIDPAFKGITGISHSQVVQTTENDVIIYVVLDRKARDYFNKDELIQNIKDRTSNLLNIKVETVDYIAKENNGKFKTVVNLSTKS